MNGPIVLVNIFLRSINDIDDYKMEFSVQVTFREQWNDERLKFDDVGGKYVPKVRERLMLMRGSCHLDRLSNVEIGVEYQINFINLIDVFLSAMSLQSHF